MTWGFFGISFTRIFGPCTTVACVATVVLVSRGTYGGGKSQATFGQVLRRLRAGRTQLEVAEAAGVSRSYLSELEHDQHGSRIPRHTVVGLAQALGVEAGVLLVLVGQPVGPADVGEPRPDFVSFVLTEPTLPTEAARAAILAVYHAVAEVDVNPGVHLVKQPAQSPQLLADPGGQGGALVGDERLRAAGDHGRERGGKGIEKVADHRRVEGGPLG